MAQAPANQAELVQELRLKCEPLGVHEKLLKGGEGGLTDATLRRWLVARNWVLATSLRDLEKHAEWRVAMVPNGRMLEADVEADLAQMKSFAQGVDREGHAVNVVLVDRHIGTGLEATKRYIVYCLDALVRISEQHGQEKVVGILDLEEMGLKNSDLSTLRAIFDLLQNHYVERLHRMYLYCAPTIFYALWRVVSPFVDPVTKSKVIFVAKKEALEEFEKSIDPQVLPTRYNGKAELKPIQQAWEELLAQQPPLQQQPAPQQQVQQAQPQPAAPEVAATPCRDAVAAEGPAPVDVRA